MEKIVAENLSKKDFDPACSQQFEVRISVAQLFDFSDRYSVDAFHDQNFLARQRPMNFRNVQRFGPFEVFSDFGRIAGFPHQI